MFQHVRVAISITLQKRSLVACNSFSGFYQRTFFGTYFISQIVYLNSCYSRFLVYEYNVLRSSHF